MKEPEKNTKEKNTRRLARTFISLLNGSFLTKEKAVQQLPFLIFLTFLGICYIANNHYAEKTVREIDKLNKGLKELRSEYITTKFDLMYRNKQSEIAEDVKQMGLKESVVPPKKITVKENR
ncbi:MAG: FtsL-like putative cell division protein [Bacteroidota bacterium]